MFTPRPNEDIMADTEGLKGNTPGDEAWIAQKKKEEEEQEKRINRYRKILNEYDNNPTFFNPADFHKLRRSSLTFGMILLLYAIGFRPFIENDKLSLLGVKWIIPVFLGIPGEYVLGGLLIFTAAYYCLRYWETKDINLVRNLVPENRDKLGKALELVAESEDEGSWKGKFPADDPTHPVKESFLSYGIAEITEKWVTVAKLNLWAPLIRNGVAFGILVMGWLCR